MWPEGSPPFGVTDTWTHCTGGPEDGLSEVQRHKAKSDRYETKCERKLDLIIEQHRI